MNQTAIMVYFLHPTPAPSVFFRDFEAFVQLLADGHLDGQCLDNMQVLYDAADLFHVSHVSYPYLEDTAESIHLC